MSSKIQVRQIVAIYICNLFIFNFAKHICIHVCILNSLVNDFLK